MTRQKFLAGVAVVLAAGLLLAPTVSAYAQRQRAAEAADVVVEVQRGPRERLAQQAAQDAYAAACLQRATADDPGDLIGTEACRRVAAPVNGMAGARKLHTKAAPQAPAGVYDATAALQLAVPDPYGR